MDAERREQRDGEHHVDEVLDRIDHERRTRVVERVEPAQRVEVDGEGHEPDRERLERVGGDRGVVRPEPAAHQNADHRLCERDEEHRGRQHEQYEVTQSEPELAPEVGKVESRGAA